MSETFDFSDGRGPVAAHRHRNPDGTLGGWVADAARVSDNAWISGDARISGNARVSGNACIFGNARVSSNARISGNARVSGNACVSGNARIFGNAWAFGNACIFGNAQIFGNAWASGEAWIFGNAQIFGKARVSSDAQVAWVDRVGTGLPMTLMATTTGWMIAAGCVTFTADTVDGVCQSVTANLAGHPSEWAHGTVKQRERWTEQVVAALAYLSSMVEDES